MTMLQMQNTTRNLIPWFPILLYNRKENIKKTFVLTFLIF